MHDAKPAATPVVASTAASRAIVSVAKALAAKKPALETGVKLSSSAER